MTITITTSTYEGSHGRKPSPNQRGLWFFAITRRPGETTTFQITATYRDALKAVKAEAKLIGGASKITLMPLRVMMRLELSISLATIAIWSLMDDSEAQDAADYQVTRDDCATLISEDMYGEHDGLCEACYDSVHFTCGECGEEFHCDDHHETYTDLCEECGCTKRTQQADELWAEIEDVAGSWSGEDPENSKLKRLLKYAKKLK